MKRSMSGKALAVLVAVVLLIGCVVGGTVAWLVAKSDPIENVFTVGDINVSLSETRVPNYHIVPGVNIAKDPNAQVKAGSENCYLFVKVDEENWPTFTEEDGTTRKVDYKLADGWTKLVDGVYYREVNKSEANQDFQILKDNQVTVSKNLTKGELNKVSTNPKLTFTVYAVQKEGVQNVSEAWNLAKDN